MDKITLSSYKSRTSAKPSQNNKSMYAVTQFVLIMYAVTQFVLIIIIIKKNIVRILNIERNIDISIDIALDYDKKFSFVDINTHANPFISIHFSIS
jgi:hypothetical protein